MSIIHKYYDACLAATTREVVHSRGEIRQRLQEIDQEIPSGVKAGAPFCVFNFITSEVNGYDVTLGIPIVEEFEPGMVRIINLPALEVLSTIHYGKPEKMGETVGRLFTYADRFGLISDEFYREVYLDENYSKGPGIEVQFVIHNWIDKLAAGVVRVLGEKAQQPLLQGSECLELESGVAQRFRWVKLMLERLDWVASKEQKYAILSGCAHVFPQAQIDKLARVFSDFRQETGSPMAAVDAVIQFMENDPGWVEGGRRKGYTIYVVKPPRDRKAFETAQTDLERRQAYCFCPLLRTQMDLGMPVDYCYCGSGWFRQQWEGAIGQPVKIDIIRSVLRGDDACEFAIRLPRGI